MNVIEARGLTKVYGGRAVVRNFSMTVAASDIYGFVGKNGAGKSTVMKMNLRRCAAHGWRGGAVRKRSGRGGGRGRWRGRMRAACGASAC